MSEGSTLAVVDCQRSRPESATSNGTELSLALLVKLQSSNRLVQTRPCDMQAWRTTLSSIQALQRWSKLCCK
eukprot:5608923-Amphidinium_carterae.1